MNDKDKEAFEKWHYENISNPPTLNDLITNAWEAACEYKKEEYSNLMNAMTRTSQYNFKLQAENAKLKSIVTLASEASCYTEYEDACSLARQVLKELEEK